MAAALEVVEQEPGQAGIQALEKELQEFSGGLAYDQARIIERTQDGFRQGVHGFYLAGLGLILIHANNGDTFTHILQQYFPGITYEAAKKYMRFARAASKLPNFRQFCLERGGYSKGLTMLQSCSEEQVEAFDETGEVLGFTQDQIDGMSVLTLKKALRRAREHERLALTKATEKDRQELAELREENKGLKAQVTAEKTPADAALALVLGANDKIFEGIRLLGKVEEATLTANKTAREQFVGVCEHAIDILMKLSTDATHAGAVEGADF